MAASKETIEHVVGTYRQAAQANRQTGLRQGNVVELGPETADEVMVTADLHGNRLIFNRLCRVADLAAHPGRHLVMQEACHGGPLYPSGTGCMSHLLLEDVARLKVDYPDRFHFLLSNHELAELTDFPIMKAKRMLNLLFRCGLQEMYGTAIDQVREAYMEFIASCPLAVRLANGVFISHSAPAAADTEPFDASIFERPLEACDFAQRGPVFQVVWGRDFRAANAETFAQLVGAELLIHGHEPCSDGYCVPNPRQIILDCCGDRACYLMLPTGEPLTQNQVVQRIRWLDGGTPDK